MPKIEDRKLTPKENYLRILTGQMPEWAPIYSMGMPIPGDTVPMAFMCPSIFNDPHPRGGGKDCWGVNWVGNYETGGAILPEPNNFLLEDIEDWHDVVKAPDVSDVDWEMLCKKDMEAFPIDREQTALGFNLYVGTFQEFVALMGFTEGLIAMYEEPEEAAALCKYINDFYVSVGKKCIEYIKPDCLVMMDDTAAAGAPFMSEDLFRQILLPTYKHVVEELALPYDIPVQFHNCGKSARFMEILHDEAHVTAWDPAQTVNDLKAFKAKWGREIALLGAWDATVEVLEPDCPDEVVAQSVMDSFDLYAPDGGYAFCGGLVGPLDDAKMNHKNEVIMRTAMEYGNMFYDGEKARHAAVSAFHAA